MKKLAAKIGSCTQSEIKLIFAMIWWAIMIIIYIISNIVQAIVLYKRHIDDIGGPIKPVFNANGKMYWFGEASKTPISYIVLGLVILFAILSIIAYINNRLEKK